MWAQEQGLGAHASPWAGTRGISLRVDSRSWPQSPLGFGKPPVILAILASAFGIQNITIFKYPIKHVHIFFCLIVSQIQQALRRLKRSITSVLWTSSSPCWHHHLPWNAYSSCGWCISPLSPHLDFSVCGILQISHCYSARVAAFLPASCHAWTT